MSVLFGKSAAKIWSNAEIVDDCSAARMEFRQRRLASSLGEYLAQFDKLEPASQRVVSELPSLIKQPAERELLAQIVGGKTLHTALRYLGAPPISNDDLKTLLGESFSARSVKRNPALASSLSQLIAATLDPKRFPWILEARTPTSSELAAAVLATTVAAASQATQAGRRTDEKKLLEGAISTTLNGLGFKKSTASSGRINNLSQAPGNGEYIRQCNLGDHNADYLIGLNGFSVALECKASNSEINSRKRLNKEVVADAKSWYQDFGDRNLVVGAALQGVFKPAYVSHAQHTPVMIIWAHRPKDLADFILANS